MSLRNQHDAARFDRIGRAVIRRQQTGFRTDGNRFVHAAIGGRNAACIPVIRDGLIAVDVVIAGIRRQLAADAAGRYADEVIIRRRAVDNFARIEVFRLVDFRHEGLPQRGGRIAAGRLGG